MTLEYGQSYTRSISEVGLEVPVACESTMFEFMKAVEFLYSVRPNLGSNEFMDGIQVRLDLPVGLLP